MSSFLGIHTTEIMFPVSLAACNALYILERYSCPDCWRGFFSASTAALLLVASMIWRSLTLCNNRDACRRATISAENGFSSVLGPKIIVKVSSHGLPRVDRGIRTTPPTPIIPFRAELLTATRTAHLLSICDATVSLTVVTGRCSHGASTNGYTVSRFSIGMSLARSATW